MTISPEAQAIFREMLADYDEGAFLRVGQIPCGGGCCGARLIFGVTIDEDFSEEGDARLDVDGLTVVMDKNLLCEADAISITVDPEKGVVVSRG